MYRFIETIRVENFKIPLLIYHLNRAECTCRHHGIDCPLAEEVILSFVKGRVKDSEIYKLRIIYGTEIVSMELSPYVIEPIKSLKMLLDDSITYEYKRADRELLSSLYLLRGVSDDILIVRDNMVTDTYYCNIAFFDGNNWFTPKLPLLCGTRRAYLIDQGIILEKEISAAMIHHFSHFKLFNAMIGWEDFPVRSTRCIRF